MRARSPLAPGSDTAVISAFEYIAVPRIVKRRANTGGVILGSSGACAVFEVLLVHFFVVVEVALASNVASLAIGELGQEFLAIARLDTRAA